MPVSDAPHTSVCQSRYPGIPCSYPHSIAREASFLCRQKTSARKRARAIQAVAAVNAKRTKTRALGTRPLGIAAGPQPPSALAIHYSGQRRSG
jgi:hypothetical protein